MFIATRWIKQDLTYICLCHVPNNVSAFRCIVQIKSPTLISFWIRFPHSIGHRPKRTWNGPVWSNRSSFLQSARFCFTSHRFPSPFPPSHGKREICITPVCYIACPAVTPLLLLSSPLPSMPSFRWPLAPPAAPKLPIPDAYKEAPTPLGLHRTSHPSPYSREPSPLLFLLKPPLPSTSPSQHRLLPSDPWNGFLASPPCSQAPHGKAQRAAALSQSHAGETVHYCRHWSTMNQSTMLWTQSTPIFITKFNPSKPISHHFAERPSSFIKINLWCLIS
jgi:hypothetical protein